MKIIIFADDVERVKTIKNAILPITINNIKFITQVDYDPEKDSYWGEPAFEKEVICFVFKTEELVNPEVKETVKRRIMEKLSFREKQIIEAHQL